MRARLVLLSIIALSVGQGATAATAGAQIEALKRRAEAEARKRLEASAKKAADDSAKKKAAADSVAKAKASGVSGAAPAAPAAPAASASASSASPATAPAAQGPAARGTAKIWENYDFVPGSKVLFYTDFSEDRAGNFARGLRKVAGPIEVVDRDGQLVLRSTGRSTFLIPLGRKLPQRFTLEVDILPTTELISDQLVFEGGRTLTRSAESAEITWNPRGTFIIGSGQDAAASAVAIPEAARAPLVGQVVHVRALMDSAYFKMYTNERRMYNEPELRFLRDSVIRVMVTGSDETPAFITAIRLAESETDVMYDALTAKGRWTTHGILFATGKAELQPESHAVLKQIAATLKQNATLKVLIEGHTDNVGSPDANLTLSESRAAAVKMVLVSEYAIDGARIATKGLGDTKPTVPNATAAGRAQNRRVEVVKQ